MQKWISWALSGLFRYLNAIQTMCPHILRYLTTAVITNKDVRKRRQVLKDLVKVIQQVRTEICCFLFIFFFYWDYNFNVPVLGLLTYFSPNSVTEFFVHCEVKCVLFAGRAKWMKYNVLSVLLFFSPPYDQGRKFQQDPWNCSQSDSFSAIPTRNCCASVVQVLLAFQDNWTVCPVLCSNSYAFLKCFITVMRGCSRW